MTLDGCLAHLKTLIQSKPADALELAIRSIDELAPDDDDDRGALIAMLGSLQSKLRVETKTSPLREDVLDAIGSKVVRLLEVN